jgi:ectoine hydroxylase-related dioxygenase (phytanoyl-CoA dioxygenase family)
MKLTHAQKRDFHDNGYVRVPGVIPRVMVNAALRAINHSVGNGMNVADMTTFRAQSYCPDIKGTTVIGDLFNATPAKALAESVIGEGKIRPIRGGQVALRFPTMEDPPKKSRPHIDGMYSPTNGVKEGTIANFTGLCGVLLSDLPEGNAGNFTVWPGTHREHERYFRERGPQSLLEGMPKIPYGDGVPVTGQAGDIVFAHYLLAHGISPNLSPHVRYAIFFRMTHVDHETQKWESMTDMWLQWPGIRDAFEPDAAPKREPATAGV